MRGKEREGLSLRRDPPSGGTTWQSQLIEHCSSSGPICAHLATSPRSTPGDNVPNHYQTTSESGSSRMKKGMPCRSKSTPPHFQQLTPIHPAISRFSNQDHFHPGIRHDQETSLMQNGASLFGSNRLETNIFDARTRNETNPSSHRCPTACCGNRPHLKGVGDWPAVHGLNRLDLSMFMSFIQCSPVNRPYKEI
jgi:hypothetical protein